jgi:hypothetical protein
LETATSELVPGKLAGYEDDVVCLAESGVRWLDRDPVVVWIGEMLAEQTTFGRGLPGSDMRTKGLEGSLNDQRARVGELCTA